MRDLQGQENSSNSVDIWSTITSGIWSPQIGDDDPQPGAKPKPQPEAPAAASSGPNDKVVAPAQPSLKDAGTAPKEKPQPKPPVDYPIPAPGGKPLGMDELIIGQKNDRGEFSSKAHGLGSDEYAERETAEHALIGLGVKALPYIDRILFGKLSEKNDKLSPAEEAARKDPEILLRLGRIRKTIVSDCARLMRDLASDDESISDRAELFLRRMPIKILVARIADQRDSLTDDQFSKISKFVFPHQSESALMADYGVKGDWSRTASPDELSRSLVVYEILGKPLAPIQARLAYSLIKNGGAPEIKKASQLLDNLAANQVDDETATCRDVCRAVLAMRTGKVEDGLKHLEAIADSMQERGKERFYDGPPLAKVCDDLNWLVLTGKLQLDDKQKQRLNALTEKTLEFRRSGIGEVLKQLGK